ncbi:MAG TPA: pyruvate kinase, partial [Bacillota bacterium]|nr:pyruvate kinase [Bacillota bacterium]
EVSEGDRILVNNGLLAFEVERVEKNNIICRTLTSGVISDRKSMSFPNKVFRQEYLSEQDKKDLLFGIENDVDYIACSFVSSAADLIAVHDFLLEHGGVDISLIAKIENRSGIDNIDEICSQCEGIMIGRGDMGVELPFEELPAIQKQLITKCRLLGKRVITATEMLESMIYNSCPTRAEISDVANAVYDGTSAIMLSGETAAGKYPVLTVETMSRIAKSTETGIHYKKRFLTSDFLIKNEMDAISHAVCGMGIDISASAIVVCSISGLTARMVSRFRPPVDIIGLSVSEKTYHQLSLSWGVVPVMSEVYSSVDVLFYNAKRSAVAALGLNRGDRIIITGGSVTGKTGATDTIRIEQV